MVGSLTRWAVGREYSVFRTIAPWLEQHLEREKRWAEYQTPFASQNPPFLTSKLQSLCLENCSEAEALIWGPERWSSCWEQSCSLRLIWLKCTYAAVSVEFSQWALDPKACEDGAGQTSWREGPHWQTLFPCSKGKTANLNIKEAVPAHCWLLYFHAQVTIIFTT